MYSGILYIGIAHSIYSILLMAIKRERKISDKIMILFLIIILSVFVVELITDTLTVNKVGLWPLGIFKYLTFPPILFLYLKYTVVKFNKFDINDSFHFIPSIIVLILVIFFYDSGKINSISTFASFFLELNELRIFLGSIFICSLWIYFFYTLKILLKSKEKVVNEYSYNSSEINLQWLLFVAVSFFILFNVLVAASLIDLRYLDVNKIEIIRNLVLVVVVYVLNVWGLKQRQLDIYEQKTLLTFSSKKTNQQEDLKYSNTGLSLDKAEEYKEKLINFVESTEAWMDNELSISKISEQINIPKHIISQVLNECIKKNFYTFINEYRIEHAIKLIKSPDYRAISFVAIAYESGFNSKSSFNNYFKKYTGMTPTEYKDTLE